LLNGLAATCRCRSPRWSSISARALIPHAPSLVYLMMLAGAMMGLSMLVLTAGPLYEMWVYGRYQRVSEVR
jgi:hypothetical protein